MIVKQKYYTWAHCLIKDRGKYYLQTGAVLRKSYEDAQFCDFVVCRVIDDFILCWRAHYRTSNNIPTLEENAILDLSQYKEVNFWG